MRARELVQLVTAIAAEPGVDEPGLPRERRRARGAYWTAPPLARYLAGRALMPLLPSARWRQGVPQLRVLDPAAGNGRLLRAAAELLLAAAAPRTPRDQRRMVRAIASSCLLAVERDPAQAAALRWSMPGLEVRTADALLDPALVDGSFDAIVANPPYLRAGHVRRDEPSQWAALRGRFVATQFGEWDLSSVFLERCWRLLAARGRAAMILPSRWLASRTAGPLRELLAAEHAVAEVVDFSAQQLFAGATTYTSVITLQRPPARRIAVARHAATGWQLGTFIAPAGRAPWTIAPARTRWPSGRVLGDVVRLAKGAGTCADGAFVVPRSTAVEPAALRACVRGRDVVAWGQFDAGASARCIVPYDVHGRAVPLARMRQAWPLAVAWLARHRPASLGPAGAPPVADGFVRFGRPQNLALHLGPLPRVVFPDVTRAPRAMIVPGGALVLDSAYAAYPREPGAAISQPEVLLTLLASPQVSAWLDERAAPLRGGYRRMKTAVLAPLPIPADGPWIDAVVAAVRCGDRAAAEAALAAAYQW